MGTQIYDFYPDLSTKRVYSIWIQEFLYCFAPDMQVFTRIGPLREFLNNQRIAGKTIGLVPTMGALHEGHVSLFRRARRDTQVVVGSIFVNPIQFNNPEDLTKYPKTPEKDLEMMKSAGCDVVFMPEIQEVYPEKPTLAMDFGSLEVVMEAKFRPGHFNGVAIVVSKLLHYVQPDHAYFGQKDLQQFMVIRKLVKDLSFQVRLHCCPVIREANGLAMSSRNQRLSQEGRAKASVLFAALTAAREIIIAGRPSETAIDKAMGMISSVPGVELEYFELADAENLQPVQEVQLDRNAALCVAAHVEGVRLIDNVLIFS